MSGIELPRLRIELVAAVAASSQLSLINRDPCPDEIGVPRNWPVALQIVDIGTDGVDRASTVITLNGIPGYDAGILPGYDGPLSTENLSADSLYIILDPVVPWESEQEVTVHVTSATVGGAYALDETYSFTIEDVTAPRLVAAQATSPKEVRLGFDEPVRIVDLEGILFEALEFPAVPLSLISASVDDSVVTITANWEMTPDVRYRVTASGTADLNGNVTLPPYDTAEFQGFRPARPANRRFDLWSMIPKHNRREDTTFELWRFIACLQDVTDLLLAEADAFPDIFNVERAMEMFLDIMLLDLGNPFLFDLTTLEKRRLISILVELYRQGGTEPGIKNAIRFFLGIEVEITPFNADTLILGESELGVDWILGPSDLFALYAFNVRVDRVLTDNERKQIRTIINYLKPCHTHFVDLEEPSPPPTYDHWELGTSELSVTTLLH